MNPGQRIGDFEILEPLGAGGQGTVYLAEQVAIGRKAVVKLLRTERHPEGADLSKESQRLEREALVLARLNHPNIVTLYTSGTTDDDEVYLVMEHVEGVTLQHIIDRQVGAMPPERALMLVDQILSGLAEAHAEGLVHRDLKPANIMVTPKAGDVELVRILDFGLAKPVSTQGLEPGITTRNAVMGTPRYMAPEQIRGRDIDGRTDLYALGLILHLMITGHHPIPSATTGIEYMVGHLGHEITSLRERYPRLPISPELDTLILKAVAKSPTDRFPDALTMQTHLRLAQGALAKTPAHASPELTGRNPPLELDTGESTRVDVFTRPQSVPPVQDDDTKDDGDTKDDDTNDDGDANDDGDTNNDHGPSMLGPSPWIIVGGLAAVAAIIAVVGFGRETPTPAVEPTPTTPPVASTAPPPVQDLSPSPPPPAKPEVQPEPVVFDPATMAKIHGQIFHKSDPLDVNALISIATPGFRKEYESFRDAELTHIEGRGLARDGTLDIAHHRDRRLVFEFRGLSESDPIPPSHQRDLCYRQYRFHAGKTGWRLIIRTPSDEEGLTCQEPTVERPQCTLAQALERAHNLGLPREGLLDFDFRPGTWSFTSQRPGSLPITLEDDCATP